ncbi:HAD-IIIA family hydrolase [Pseudokineococcus basanitobsidens]|uniref:D,D-heptose 1,7-bisphosphate phosphatase n=1 Tax=Pseudokineococcus basanitobsidens TaxID=1926649 RepID=A0ABU8RHP9_9ACTN
MSPAAEDREDNGHGGAGGHGSATDAPPRYDVVVPSIGRPSLLALLRSLAAQDGPPPAEVVVVDDRAAPDDGLEQELLAALVGDDAPAWPLRVVRSRGRGPAGARNLGWAVASSPWVAFLDDDVLLPGGWADGLAADLAACDERTGGTQGRLSVPLPADRRPTDWERGTRGLEDAAWATADMAYRRSALVAVDGFDERFPRAYREDADLALRVRRAGWSLVRGRRTTTHPVRPTDPWVSLRVQAGNRDDATMRALHGAGWRTQAQVPRGRLRWHAATCAAAALGAAGVLLGRPRTAALGAAGWAALTADFARRRIAPGPRTAAEVRAMVLTSVAIPPAAVRHRVVGAWRTRAGLAPWRPPVRAVLFDRDGTLVHDVPYNGDPARVEPVEGAREVVEALRDAGVAVGVVSNQSGVARGLLTPGQVDAVNAEVDRRVGPLATWQWCPHGAEDGCRCRKPGPGLVERAAASLGVAAGECAVVGDIGADVGAAQAAGARSVLVPTPVTRAREVRDAPLVADDLARAVELLVPGLVVPRPSSSAPPTPSARSARSAPTGTTATGTTTTGTTATGTTTTGTTATGTTTTGTTATGTTTTGTTATGTTTTGTTATGTTTTGTTATGTTTTGTTATGTTTTGTTATGTTTTGTTATGTTTTGTTATGTTTTGTTATGTTTTGTTATGTTTTGTTATGTTTTGTTATGTTTTGTTATGTTTTGTTATGTTTTGTTATGTTTTGTTATGTTTTGTTATGTTTTGTTATGTTTTGTTATGTTTTGTTATGTTTTGTTATGTTTTGTTATGTTTTGTTATGTTTTGTTATGTTTTGTTATGTTTTGTSPTP